MSELDLVLDHVTLSVHDMSRAKRFYKFALLPLELEIVADFIDDQVPVCGFGKGRKGSFWLAQDGQQSPSFHIAFRAPDRNSVRDFYHAALQAGGRDNGAPGIREIYHPAYYAAFVLDLEGHNIEAVTFEPEGAA